MKTARNAAATTHRAHERPRGDAARLERRDLVLRRQPAEGEQHRHEHRHRQRQRDRQRDRQDEELEDHLPRQAAPHQVAELSRDELEQHERRERRQGENERPDVFLQDVPADFLHVFIGRARSVVCCGTSSTPQGCTAVAGLYIPPTASSNSRLPRDVTAGVPRANGAGPRHEPLAASYPTVRVWCDPCILRREPF